MATVGAFTRSVWGKRLPVSSGAASGKTYADFQAYIATQATDGVVAWGASAMSTGAYRTTAATATGAMIGSSWNASFSMLGGGGAPCRVTQHGLPSQAEFNAQVAAGREIFLRIIVGDDIGYSSLNRNGFTSSSGGADAFPAKCSELIYWDGSQAQRMIPSTGTGPTPFVIP